MPVPAIQAPSGTIIVREPPVPEGQAVVYARVSSSDQKSNIDGQVARCVAFANSRGLGIASVVSEAGSGLNGQRKKWMSLLSNPKVKMVVVEHRDRLMRFGSEYVEAALQARGALLIVADESELKDDLVQDILAVLTSFCARWYGRRSASHRAQKAMAAIDG